MPAANRAVTVIAALAFATFYVAALFGVMDLPEEADTDAAVLATYTDSGKRAGLTAGVYLLAAAGLSFLWFLASLRARLRPKNGDAPLATIALAGGLVYVAMLFTAGAAFGVLPLAIGVGEFEAQSVDPDLARVLVQFGFTILLIYGLLAAAVMVLATSLAAFRDAALPRWLAIAGFIVAALLLLGPIYVPQLLVPLWAVATAIALARRPVGAPTTQSHRT
jgi:hypothetical protein